MALTFDELKALVDKEGLKYYVDPANPRMLLGGVGMFGSFQFVMALENEGEFLQLRTFNYHFCPAKHPHLLEVLKVLVSLNERLRLVKFGWDASTGEILAFADMWIMDSTFTPRQLHQILGNFLTSVDINSPRIRKTLDTGADPGEATADDIMKVMGGSPEVPSKPREAMDKVKDKKEGPKPPDGGPKVPDQL